MLDSTTFDKIYSRTRVLTVNGVYFIQTFLEKVKLQVVSSGKKLIKKIKRHKSKEEQMYGPNVFFWLSLS